MTKNLAKIRQKIMNKATKLAIFCLSVAFLSILGALSINVVLGVWNQPTCDPEVDPDLCNVAAPITVSNTAQHIEGKLRIGDTNTPTDTLEVVGNICLNADCISIWPSGGGGGGGWVDDGTTVRLETSTDKVGIGTSSPNSFTLLHLSGDNLDLYHDSYNSLSSSAKADYELRRARGIEASASSVIAGDQLGSIRYAGHDGSTFITSGQILAVVDGTPATGNMPTRLEFKTLSDGSSTLGIRMVIKESGDIILGGTDTSAPGYFDFSRGGVLDSARIAGALNVAGNANLGSESHGIYGETSADQRMGIYGQGLAGSSGGVYGSTAQAGSYGVYGINSGAAGYGVFGAAQAYTGTPTAGAGVVGGTDTLGLIGVYGGNTGGGYAGYFDGLVKIADEDIAANQDAVLEVTASVNSLTSAIYGKSYAINASPDTPQNVKAGVFGEAITPSAGNSTFAIFGKAGDTTQFNSTSYAIYGMEGNDAVNGLSYAGYFSGDVAITGDLDVEGGILATSFKTALGNAVNMETFGPQLVTGNGGQYTWDFIGVDEILSISSVYESALMEGKWYSNYYNSGNSPNAPNYYTDLYYDFFDSKIHLRNWNSNALTYKVFVMYRPTP